MKQLEETGLLLTLLMRLPATADGVEGPQREAFNTHRLDVEEIIFAVLPPSASA